MENKKLSVREWISFILIGLAGQLAWSIENNYLNMWVYSQTHDASYITWMTYASAIAATLTTFFMGVLSDRLGKRKIFIAGGYVIWGISVGLFSIFSLKNMTATFGAGGAAIGVGIGMVIWDCVMTFFGSTSNDACFNSRVTDVTTTENRGKVESILSVLPLFAGIAVVLVGGLIGANSSPSKAQLQAMTQAGLDTTDPAAVANYLAKPWMWFFLIFGIVVVVVGIVAFFLMEPDHIEPNKTTNYWKQLVHGFKPSVIKEHKNLYIALLAFFCFNCAINAFMPYYMVYIQNPANIGGLGITDNFAVVVGVILLVASLIVIVIGLFMDKIGKNKLLIPGVAIAAAGFLMFFFTKEMSNQYWYVILAGIIMMAGYLICTAVFGATVRDETPKGEVGLFQGIRMIFVVMLPMIVGPAVSNLFFKYGPEHYIYDNGLGNAATIAPTRWMFMASLIFIIVALAPIVWLLVSQKKTGTKAPVETKKE